MKLWRFILFVFLLGFLLPLTLRADEIKLCRSPYALTSENFKYQEHVKQTKDVGPYIVVWLWNSFGNKLSNAAAELARPVVLGAEVALFNTTCVRGGTCAPYETLAGYSISSLSAAINNNDPRLKKKIVDEATRAANWLKANIPQGKACYYSMFLENDMNRPTFQKALSWIAPLFEGWCTPVWNPVGGNPGQPVPPAVVTEGHGSAPVFPAGARFIANPDGTAISQSEYPSYLYKYGSNPNAVFACAWDGEVDNCRPMGAPASPPRSRQCRETAGFKRMHDALIGARKLNQTIPAWTAEDEKGKAGCKTYLDTSDGYKKNFLWKQSDPPCCGRGAVTFLPTKYNKTFIGYGKVYVMKGSQRIATAYERGVYTEDKSNRQFYRFRKLATDFPYNVVAHYGGDICAVIKNPKIRND